MGDLLERALETGRFHEMELIPVPAKEGRSEYIILLVDGVYDKSIPQTFMEKELASNWGITPEDEAVLMDGPNNIHYWEVWQEILKTAHADLGGCKWHLIHAPSGLYMVREDTPVHMLEGELGVCSASN
jgi:hypothetical protein